MPKNRHFWLDALVIKYQDWLYGRCLSAIAMSDYLIYADQQVTGPFTLQELRAMWRDGGITTDTLCSQNGGGWIPFGNLDTDAEMAAQKRILPAFLLLLFLGLLGAHAFYAGRKAQGTYYLLVSAGFLPSAQCPQ